MQITGFSTKTLRNVVAAGGLVPVMIPGAKQVRFLKSDVERLVKRKGTK